MNRSPFLYQGAFRNELPEGTLEHRVRASGRHEQPVVVPQSMHTLQVPFWTIRELPQLGQVLPS